MNVYFQLIFQATHNERVGVGEIKYVVKSSRKPEGRMRLRLRMRMSWIE